MKCVEDALLTGKNLNIIANMTETPATSGKVNITAGSDLNLEALINAYIKANAVLEIDSNLIKIGSGASTEFMVKGTSLVSDLVNHTHIGNLGYPVSPAAGANPAIFNSINLLSTKTVVE